METCVLIPQEFSLVLSSPPGSPRDDRLDALDGVYLKNHNNNDVLKGHREPVTVWTNARIPQGTVVYPFQGTVRLDTLAVYSQLHDADVSTDAHSGHALLGTPALPFLLLIPRMLFSACPWPDACVGGSGGRVRE